jgi:hypothetical protein
MNHILLGASVPFVIGAIIYMCKGLRAPLPMLIIIPVCMALGALWAVAPDLPRLFGMQELYMRLYLDPRCNIFLWHYKIDRIETEDALRSTVVLVIMTAIMMFAAWRELDLAEKET